MTRIVRGRLVRLALMALFVLALMFGFTGSAAAVSPPVVTEVSPDAGSVAGGTVVTITGYAFAGTTAVSFGGQPAIFTENSATQITATAPSYPSAVQVDVLVTTAVGTSTVVPEDKFLYVDPPTVTNLAPTTGSTDGGQKVVITGTSFDTASEVTFDGTDADSFEVKSDTEIWAWTPAHGAGVFDVMVTNAATTSADTAADDFTFVAAPAITNLSPTYGPVGGGTDVTITGTSFTTATKVMFGDKNATSFTVDSDIQITAKAPAVAASTTVRVKVITSYGTSADTPADDFGYVEGNRYQESNSKITYGGVWRQSGLAWWASGDSYTYSSQPGAAVVVNFTGTEVKVLAKKCPWYGKARIMVDGAFEEIVDLYSSKLYQEWQQTVYTKTGLAYGSHTLTIECLGEKNASSWGTTICLDAVDINGVLAQAQSIKKVDDKDATYCAYDADWKRWDNSGYWAAYMDTYAFTDKEDAEMTFTFEGTFASWIAYTSMTKGKAEVTLDPGTPEEKTTTIDLCTAGHIWKNNVYSTGILADGAHTLVIKCLREKSWWAWWYTINADRFEILESTS